MQILLDSSCITLCKQLNVCYLASPSHLTAMCQESGCSWWSMQALAGSSSLRQHCRTV